MVVTSEELEERLEPVYAALHMSMGQLESLTGISERRWWEKNFHLSQGATIAGKRALKASGVSANDLSVLIYAGVNRENFEPATACRVASELGLRGDVAVYDVSNACLGLLNGMIDIANRIELGQIRAGMVVSCETAREINDITIERMIEHPGMEMFTKSLATLTGGSGAVAVLLSDGSFESAEAHRMVGGAIRAHPEFHNLCHWGLAQDNGRALRPVMETNAVYVENTIEFLQGLGVTSVGIDRVRGIGRGNALTPNASPFEELCGSCWKGKLCINPDGEVSPCVFSWFHTVGNVKQGLPNILKSETLHDFRTRSRAQDLKRFNCQPRYCPPDLQPCMPECAPACQPCVPEMRVDITG